MHDYDYFLRPLPPPRPTAHLWIGALLCGLSLGLGAFYIQELQGAQPAQKVVLDLESRQWPTTASSTQIKNLLADVKGLMEDLRQTRRALVEAQTRIAALEQENGALRDAKMTTASLHEPVVPPATPPAATPAVEGMGGPLVRVPEPTEIAAKTKGPRACWMRGGTMISTYRIVVRDDGFALAPAWADEGQGAWPEEFSPAMAGFRGEPLTARENVSRADFKKIMRPYFNHGMKQDAHCRFLVAVIDETSNHQAWESGVSLIERYFFKKIRGGGAEEIAFSGAR